MMTLEERLHRAAERNGLPGMGDLGEVRGHLHDLANILDDGVADTKAAVDAWMDKVAIPFEIDVEHIAAIGLIIQEGREHITEIGSYLDRLANDLPAIDAARCLQADEPKGEEDGR